MIDLLDIAIGATAAVATYAFVRVIQGIRRRPVKGRAIRRRDDGNG